jgi:hypothetical protein
MRFASIVSILIIAILVVLPATAQHASQNINPQPTVTTSGIFGDVGFQTGSWSHDGGSDHGENAFGLNLGYLVNSLFGVGVGIESAKPDMDGAESTTIVSPRVIFVPLRQNDSMPVSVYGDLSYRLYMLPDSYEDYSITGWSLALGVTREVSATETINVYPHVNFAYTGVTEEYTYTAAVKRSESDKYTTNPIYVSLGVAAVMAMGPGRLSVNPFFTYHREKYEYEGKRSESTTYTGNYFGLRIGFALTK